MFLAAAGGPRLGPAIDIAKIPGLKKTGALVSMLPSVRELRTAFLSDLGLPVDGLGLLNLRVRFDDRNTQTALAGTGIGCPPLKSYAKPLYRYNGDHLDPMRQRPVREASPSWTKRKNRKLSVGSSPSRSTRTVPLRSTIRTATMNAGYSGPLS